MPDSEWSVVDDAADPRKLVTTLDVLRSEPFFAESKARLDALLAATDAARVLDIGCGTGDDVIALGREPIGIERSVVMCDEARSRHASLAVIAADATALPIRDWQADGVRADRVIQHLPDAPAALSEWRRVLRPNGRLVSFDPDLTTARVDGVDERAARVILNRRAGTRPGATSVHVLANALRAAGFVDVYVEPRVLDLRDLDRADGIMGLATWGRAAADAGALPPGDGRRWSADVRNAARAGTLRYRCTYLLAAATAG